MKVLVTGCLGFIGSNVVPKLLKAGYTVIGFDNLSATSINPTDRMKAEAGDTWSNFKFYECDIRNLSVMQTICVNEAPDYIVHLAALGSVPRSFQSPHEVVDVNERGFVNVMMLGSHLNIKRIVFASSSSVYGNSPYSVKTEGAEGIPLSPYALSKAHNEAFAKIWCRGIPLEFVGLRFFNVYGPGQSYHSGYSAVIPKFINSPKITIFGDGETVRDFTYVEDVAQAVLQALICEAKNFVCNVGTGEGTTLNQLAKLIGGDLTEIEHISERPMDVKHSVADVTRVRDTLNFKAAFSLRQGLEKTIQFYESLYIKETA